MTRKEERRLAKYEAKRNEQRDKLMEQMTKSGVVNDLVIEINTLYALGKTDKEFTDKLYRLAKILCHSKLKRLNGSENTWTPFTEELAKILSRTMLKDVGGNYYLASETLVTLTEEYDSLFYEKYDRNGDPVILCKDMDYAKDLDKRIKQIYKELVSLDSANDLLQSAVTELWNYLVKNGSLTALSDRLVNSSVYYRNGHAKPEALWKYNVVNGVKKCSLEISKVIESSRGIRETENSYDVLTYECKGTLVRHYYRLKGICANDPECYRIAENMLKAIKCPAGRARIFKKVVLEEMSVKEYSDKYEVKESFVERELTTVKEQIAKSGYFESLTACKDFSVERKNNDECKKAVIVKNAKGDRINVFESLGECAKALNIDKGNISKCLSGKRNTVKGLCFEYVKTA